jgi:uncharacterized protein YbaR (Trm112 family)
VRTDLIDLLRCPGEHVDSWLVASSTSTIARHIVEGVVGCPVCRASFRITDGEVRFDLAGGRGSGAVADTVAPDERWRDPALAMRLAAQLHLVDAPQPVMLMGEWAEAAHALLQVVPNTVVLVADARRTGVAARAAGAIRLPVARIPLATGSVRAVALDAAHATAALLSEVARVVRAGGRLVAPAGVPLDPESWAQLAADDAVQVAHREVPPSAPVTLRRAPAAPLFR